MLFQETKTPIPPFESAGRIIASLAKLMRPKERLTVSQWAIENIGYDPEVAPWQMEVMDALSDPQTSEVGLMGPAQQGKSEIGLAWLGWSIEHDPADVLVCQPDKTLMQDFVVRRIAPMISTTPILKGEQLGTVGADNIFLKQFRAMILTSVWPVASQFRARPVPRGWLDDFDQIDSDIEGQGSPVGLLDARAESFEGRDTKFVSSSPARDAGKCDIEAFVAAGTDERLMPLCPSCGERFEPDLMRDLRFDKGTPDLAAQTAHVVCPKSGCVLMPDMQRHLVASTGDLPNRGFVATRPTAGLRRRGFRVDGLLGFRSWPERARQYREAQLQWEARQDESALKAFANTAAGKNYRSILSGEEPLKADDLRKRREPGFQLGTVPPGVVAIVILVDVQASSFQCAAVGWGDGLESWLIDRWSIDVLDDGMTALTPFSRPEHAEALLPLWNKTWPLADGSGQSPPPLAVGIDTGGGGTKSESWTSSVKRLWHKATEPISHGGWGIQRTRVVLLKGGNNPNAKLMPPAEFVDRKAKGTPKRNAPQLWMPNVHKIKNMVDVRLRRETPGPGYIHFPGADRPGAPKRERNDKVRGLDDEFFDEITAEELKAGRWAKLRPRNETWDHLVYAYAVILTPGRAQSRSDMRWVPKPFRVPVQAAPQLVLEGAATVPVPPPPPSISDTPLGRGPVAASFPSAPRPKVNPITGRSRGSFLNSPSRRR